MSFTQFFLSSREGGGGFVTWKLNMQVYKSSDGPTGEGNLVEVLDLEGNRKGL